MNWFLMTLHHALVMLWETFWALVLGFGISRRARSRIVLDLDGGMLDGEFAVIVGRLPGGSDGRTV